MTISQSLIGMKRATQSASLQAGRPIIPTDISFRPTHAGSRSSDLHGLASLTETCPPEYCFSDAYSEGAGACQQSRIYIYRDTLTKGFMFTRRIPFRRDLEGFAGFFSMGHVEIHFYNIIERLPLICYLHTLIDAWYEKKSNTYI